MTTFLSTRGPPATTLRDALHEGLAPDGGLYVPVELVRLGRPPAGPEASFTEVARAAGRWLLPDVPPNVIDRIVSEAFDFPVPLVEVEPGVHVLELFHGPTHAFKDFGARFMARLVAALDPGLEARTVLVATSGDTGGAVAHAFAGLPGHRVVALFPRDGVSERQRRQMTTLGGNVVAVAVDGTFDDCQTLAKTAFLDARLSARHGLTSANSINVGRLLPQTFYYVYAAARLGWSERPPLFSVPCGNLGNLFAGLYAHRAGMPASGFAAATNSNRIFVDYLSSGVMYPRPAVRTDSSAMDVRDPSNLERIRWLYRKDPATLKRHVHGVSVTDEQTQACIRDVHERTGYLLDPHGAVAYRAQELLREERATDGAPAPGAEAAHERAGRDPRGPSERDGSGAGSRVAAEAMRSSTELDGPTVVLATAHPAKFPEVIEEATGRTVPVPDNIAAVLDAEEHMERIEPTLPALSRVLEATRA